MPYFSKQPPYPTGKSATCSWRRVEPPETRAPAKLRLARTCYDHLAGEIAVKIFDRMVEEEWISADGTMIMPSGKIHLQNAGVVIDVKTRRKACSACLDWSERRLHLGGEAGAAFLNGCEQKGWLNRIPGYHEINITYAGKACLKIYLT